MNSIRINILPIFLFCAITFTGCKNTSSSDSHNKYALSDTTGKAVITFSKVEHNFGNVSEGERVAHIFSFTNTGDADLVVSSVLTSCGCTVPKFDKKPISPGEKGSVEVIYDSSGRSGKQTKTITVQSNAENKVIILRIIADVINKKE